MNDLYREIMVKRKKSPLDSMKKVGLIVLTVVLFAAGMLINPLILLLGVVSCFVTWYFGASFDVEYEYLYVNGDIDIDKIMGKQRRKRVGSYELEAMEILAPTGSHELDPYKDRAKVKNFTSLEPGVKSVTGVYAVDNQLYMVELELDRDVIEDIRRIAPRKVSRECLTLLQ